MGRSLADFGTGATAFAVLIGFLICKLCGDGKEIKVRISSRHDGFS
jgi:hypothetical protein